MYEVTTGFGVVLLREGIEVLGVREGGVGQQPDIRLPPCPYRSLPNGKLGITIERERKFRLLASTVIAGVWG
jgi:hypothetical protein